MLLSAVAGHRRRRNSREWHLSVPIEPWIDFGRFLHDFFKLDSHLRSFKAKEDVGNVNFMFEEALGIIWIMESRFQYRFGTSDRYKGFQVKLSIHIHKLHLLQQFVRIFKLWFTLNLILDWDAMKNTCISILFNHFSLEFCIKYVIFILQTQRYIH